MADELIQEFLVESSEGLDRLDREFVELEKDPKNPELLASIFRLIHTIKGSCGFLGFSKLQGIAHAGESLLSLMRDGKLLLSPPIADTLLAMVDAIRGLLSKIETSGSEGDAEHSSLIQQLSDLQQSRSEPQRGEQPAPEPPQTAKNEGGEKVETPSANEGGRGAKSLMPSKILNGKKKRPPNRLAKPGTRQADTHGPQWEWIPAR